MKKLLIFFAVVTSGIAMACKCGLTSFGERFQQSTFIAEIEVLETSNLTPLENTFFRTDEYGDLYKAKIRILKLYKGKPVSYIIVRGKLDERSKIIEDYGGDCSTQLSIGDKKLIYTNIESNFGFNSCSHSVNLHNESAEIEREALLFLSTNKLNITALTIVNLNKQLQIYKNMSRKALFAAYKIETDAENAINHAEIIKPFGNQYDNRILKIISNNRVAFNYHNMSENSGVLVVFYYPEANFLQQNFSQF